MFDRLKGSHRGLRMPQAIEICFTAALTIVLICGTEAPCAQASKQEGWYRLRTNSVPYEPQNVTLDSAGGVRVTAADVVEYAPGVWYRPATPPQSPFQYFTNNERNNLLSPSFNPPIVKPQLNASVLYAIGDKSGNTWYSLKNRTVLCEKADHSWLTFNMPDSSPYQPYVDTTNVDSAHRIRLLDKADGSQEILLIAMRGIIRISAGLSVVETRQVYETSNNYFIRDALIDSQGRYWVTSEMGVEKGTSLVNTAYVKDIFPSDTYPNAATGTTTTRIAEDSAGSIWFNSSEGIYCFTTGGPWNKYADGLVAAIGRRVNDIAAGSDGAVWFGAVYYDSDDKSTGGVLRYVPANGGQWTHYTQADLGLESGAVLSLAVDSGNGLWFVTAYNPSITGNGTGVHYLTFDEGQPNVTHYTYRDNSTTLTTLRFNYIAADLSGGVWFSGYDSPSIARLKADGSWQQFRQTGTGSFGSFGFAGAAADSKNRVYFAPQNAPPVAYDVTTEAWIDLPAAPFANYYYYGAYVDPQDGKWFHGASFVYYLDPNNTAWTSIGTDAITPAFPGSDYDYVENGVLVDDAQNAWFMARYRIVLMKKDSGGGAPTWFSFSSNDGSGYTGGYRIYQDDAGQVWNAAKQKFNSTNNTWVTTADTTAFDQRQMRFLNGGVSANMDLSGALSPITSLEENNMTVDSRGSVYFTGSLGNVFAGIVVFGPPNGDVDHNSRVDLADAILAAKVMVISTTQAFAGGDVSGDGKIGLAEMIFILQKVAGMR